MSYQVTFPNQQIINLPAATVEAILASKAKYEKPLWQYRAEKVLKLGGHQWIFPSSVESARSLFAEHPNGIVATAWKLFNRGWLSAAEEYFVDTARYPNHPRHFGQNVIPLVDEDIVGGEGVSGGGGSQQIGWVRINQYTQADEHYAVFVQFTLLEMFEARALPSEYA